MNINSNGHVDTIINKCTSSLENNTYNMNVVGNRMHYPMLININGKNASMAKQIYGRAFKRMWPQTHDNIIFIQNDLESVDSFTDMQTGSAISVEELQNGLDLIKRKHGVFGDYLKLCVYNIIDTITLNSLEQFIYQYNLINALKNIASMSTQSLLLVLLDDSTAKKELSTSIRNFLSTGKLYDGNVVIANKTITGEMYNVEEIIRISASVVVLSNNDAVSSDDDADYFERVNTIYDGGISTVAHSLLMRPNRKIAIQILDYLVTASQNILIDKNASYSIDEWRKALGLTHGTISYFEQKLNTLDISFNAEELQYIPYKNIPIENFDFNNITYSYFAKFIYDETFNQYIQKQCIERLISSNIIDDLLSQFEDELRHSITPVNCASLSKDMMDSLMNELIDKSPSTEMTVVDYYMAKARSLIRQNYLYPRVREILERLSENSEKTIYEFTQIKNEFISKIPLEGYEELGTFYSTIAENYINSPKGTEQIRHVITPGNTKEDFVRELIVAFDNVLKINEDKFTLTFIDEWVQRLNLAGEVIFKKILSTFNDDFEKRLFLFGNYPRRNKLDTYLFHTLDNRMQPTDLFNHLRNAFKNIEHVQFINSGYDDLVESIRFIDCSGSKIVL